MSSTAKRLYGCLSRLITLRLTLQTTASSYSSRLLLSSADSSSSAPE